MYHQPTAPRYSGYAGNKLFVVRHPTHGEHCVYAPSAVAAIIAAAEDWGETWQDERFYNACTPERVCE